MDVRELVNIAKYLQETLQQPKLPNRYNNLISALQQAAQGQNVEQVAVRREEVEEVHRSAASQTLSIAEQLLLKWLNADAVVGSGALARIAAIFRRAEANPHAAIAEFQQLQQETATVAQRAATIIQSVEPMLEVAPPEPLEPNEARLLLFFEGGAEVQTIEKLRLAARDWQAILRDFSRIAEGGEQGRLLSIRLASPLYVELAAALPVLFMLNLGLKALLNRVAQILEITQKYEELRSLRIGREALAALRDDIKARRSAAVADATKEVVDTLPDTDRMRGPVDGEAVRAIEMSLGKVLKMIEAGGKIDVTDLPEEEAPAEGGADSEEGATTRTRPARIGEMVDEIRRLQAHVDEIKRLGPGRAEPEAGQANSDRQAEDED